MTLAPWLANLGAWSAPVAALVLAAAVVAAAGAAAEPAIGPSTPPRLRFEYVATVAGLPWFVGEAGILAGMAWRSGKKHAA